MRYFVLLSCFLLLALSSQAQDRPTKFRRFSFNKFEDADKTKLDYRLMYPKDFDPNHAYPLVLALHGAGTRGDLENILKNTGSAMLRDSTDYPCIMIVPHCPKGNRWVEVPWGDDSHQFSKKPSKYMAAALSLLDFYRSQLYVDNDRVYIMGLSMGGFGVWDAIARRPNTFAAAVPICGGADLHTASKIKHLPIWIFHGGDDTVVWTSRSVKMFDALQKAGATQVKCTIYPNVGHPSWKKVYQEPQLLSWLFSQKRQK